MATVTVNGTQVQLADDPATLRILQNFSNAGQNPLKVAGYAMVPNGTAGYTVDAAKGGKVLLTFYYNSDGSISTNTVDVTNGSWLSMYGQAFNHPVDPNVTVGYADKPATQQATQTQQTQATDQPTQLTGHPGDQAPGAPAFTPTQLPGADPNQPFGQGFGTDYGLNLNQPNGFTETGPANPQTTGIPAQGTAKTPNDQGSATGVQQVLGSPGGVRQPDQPSTPGYPGPRPAGPGGITAQPALSTGPPSVATGGAAAPPAPSGGSTAPTGSTGGSGGGSGGLGSGGTSDQRNALATLTQILQQYGLGSLASWAWNEIVQGASEPQILLDMMNTPEFKQRFPAIAARQKAGLPPISPGDYVNYEAQATQMMRAAGLPAGFWDSPSDFTSLISSDVSLNELQQRVQLASQAAFQVPGDVRAVLQRDYGITAGDLAANFLDPKQAEPVLQRKFTAAQIGGAAWRTGYGSTRSEDEYLTDLGVSATQAQQGFNQLTGQRQLFSSLPGENTTGIGRDQQLGAEFAGNASDQEAITRRANQRVGVFSGGGGFGNTQQGFAVGAAQGV